MHSSFFHLKVIVFIHVWFAECWNSSQATLISPSLILFPFMRLKTQLLFQGKSEALHFLTACIILLAHQGHRAYTACWGVWCRTWVALWLVYGGTLHARTGMELHILPFRRGRGVFRAHSLNKSHQFITLLEQIQNILHHPYLSHCSNEVFALSPFGWSPAPWAISATCLAFCTRRCRSVM